MYRRVKRDELNAWKMVGNGWKFTKAWDAVHGNGTHSKLMWRMEIIVLFVLCVSFNLALGSWLFSLYTLYAHAQGYLGKERAHPVKNYELLYIVSWNRMKTSLMTLIRSPLFQITEP